MVIFHSYVSLPEGVWIEHDGTLCHLQEGHVFFAKHDQ